MDKQDKRVRFLAKLPPDLHHRLKVTAAEQGVTMNDLIVTAVTEHLSCIPDPGCDPANWTTREVPTS